MVQTIYLQANLQRKNKCAHYLPKYGDKDIAFQQIIQFANISLTCMCEIAIFKAPNQLKTYQYFLLNWS